MNGTPQVNVFVDEPTTLEEDFRPLPFGIFRTMAPRIKITVTGADPLPGQFEVLVDDGEDATDEWLDISSLFSFNGGSAVANIPATAAINSFPGPNQAVFRALIDCLGTEFKWNR